MISLSEIEVGQRCRVVEVESSSDSIGLLELGLMPGSEIELKMIAPMGDPIAVEVLGSTLALRKKEASLISVIKID